MSGDPWRINTRARLDHLIDAEYRAQVREEKKAYLTKRMRMNSWRPDFFRISAVPDVEYPYDPAVLRAIREFDPNTIPLTITRGFRAQTGEVRTFKFHVLSSHRWDPKQAPSRACAFVIMPTWGNAPHPTHIDLHLENRELRPGNGLPGGYIPFDWGVYYALRSSYQEWTAQELRTWLEQNDRAAQARVRREQAEKRVNGAIDRDGARIMGHIRNFSREDAIRLRKRWLEAGRRPQVTVPEKVTPA